MKIQTSCILTIFLVALSFVVLFITVNILVMSSVFSEESHMISATLNNKTMIDQIFDVPKPYPILKDHQNTSAEVESILQELRYQIGHEMRGYKSPSFQKLEDLIPEQGGNPVRSVVVTSWRSGSTFTAGVLNSHPATYLFSEPLTDYKTEQVRGEPHSSLSLYTLRNLLACNYSALGGYVDRSNKYSWLYKFNTRVWPYCEKHESLCWEPKYLEAICRLFPFQVMKLAHIRLRLVEELLIDSELNVRILLLVRDPRGIMESRARLDWCQMEEDCRNPVNLCADSVDDYSAALRYSHLYPERFKVVRYEDIALKPGVQIPNIFNFFGLQYHSDVQQFVHDHTTQSEDDVYSIYRNSSATAIKWRIKSNYSRVIQLQRICRVALSAWGYLLAKSSSHLLEFNPLSEPFSIS